MGVSKNRGIPKWMVYNGKPYKMDDFLGYHYFRKHPYKLNTCSGKFLGRSKLNVDSPLASGIPLKVEGDDLLFFELVGYQTHDGFMGLEYLPTFPRKHKFMPFILVNIPNIDPMGQKDMMFRSD